MSNLMSLTGVAWYMLPLAMVISLVYSASRYELPEYILSRALKLFVQIVVFMMIAFGILWVLTYAL